MSGLSGIGHSPGVRRLPRPGRAGGSCGCLFVPGLPERRSRRGSGPGGTLARGGCGRGAGCSVPCSVTVRVLAGRTFPSRVYGAPRPAARSLTAPPQGATSGVQPRSTGALAGAPVGVQPTAVPGVPSRGAGKAAASSRPALPSRRASVVTSAKRTATRSERASDDAVRRNPNVEETGLQRGFSGFGDRGPKSAVKCRKVKTRFFSPPGKKQ